LTRIKDNNTPGPGVAETWDVSTDGLKYTFHFRKDAKWSDGQIVTSKDFDYAWKRVLDPLMASEYANQLFYVKNAKEYYEGKAKLEDVGIKVVDDYTLEVTLHSPCPYFLELCAFHTLSPVRKDVVDKNPDAWFTDPATYIGNGPFKMLKWVHNDSMEFVKSDTYWDAKSINLTKMKWVMINDEQASLAAWEGGAIDVAQTFPGSEAPRLIQEGKLILTPRLGTYYMKYNVTKKPLDDVRVRQALTLAINRQQLIDAATKTGEKPGLAFVPPGIADSDTSKEFRTVGGDYIPNQDVEKAKALLAEAGYPDGKGFPQLEYLYNTSETHRVIAEAIQDMWKQNLGIDIKLTNQEFKVYLDSQDNLKYDISRSGWIGDYMDPMTFIDMFVTNDGNNDTGWSNAKYDELVKTTKSEADQAKRMQYMHDAEKILMDEMPVGPIYFYVNKNLIKTKITGIHVSLTGQLNFDHAKVTE
jgi:oligopeptide transport system substrate-binding protein